MDSGIDPSERDRLRLAWRATTCELADGEAWSPVPRDAAAPATLVVTAWNPWSRRLPDAVNAARDRVLAVELAALALPSRRARGRSPDGAWQEDGWAVEHREEASSLALIRAYGQLAGFVFAHGGRALLWADGRLDWLEPTVDARSGGAS
jgi:hypothetical protein